MMIEICGISILLINSSKSLVKPSITSMTKLKQILRKVLVIQICKRCIQKIIKNKILIKLKFLIQKIKGKEISKKLDNKDKKI